MRTFCVCVCVCVCVLCVCVCVCACVCVCSTIESLVVSFRLATENRCLNICCAFFSSQGSCDKQKLTFVVI